VRTRKPDPSKNARGLLRGALALLVLSTAARGLVACGDGAVNAAKAGDAGASDATSVSPDAMADASDATLGASDASDAMAAADSDSASDDAAPSCAVDAGPLDDAQVALGQQTVAARKCPSCHGETLSGNSNGVLSPTTEGGMAYPPNLTSDPATGLGCWTNAQIENAILNGIDNEGVRLCPPMPRFGHIDGGLDLAGAQAVVQYLRSLPIISQNVPSTPDCTPVADAQAEAAADATSDAVADAVGAPEAGDAGPGAAGDAAGDGPEGGD
jgi:hypothetical protein